ncbi:MAG: hypothetical protein GEU92_07660 [Alphaproteobacteria bacterium]|nr:hypothetical protein [Alphaproteobacteria bacterium]
MKPVVRREGSTAGRDAIALAADDLAVLVEELADVAGIAAECGLGRGDPARLASVLETHAACVHAAAAS